MSSCDDTSPDYEVIWLEPRCYHGGYAERHWCQDPQEPCEECGAQWIKFIRAPDQPERKIIHELQD
jgi:hypothetical protein